MQTVLQMFYLRKKHEKISIFCQNFRKNDSNTLPVPTGPVAKTGWEFLIKFVITKLYRTVSTVGTTNLKNGSLKFNI